MLCSSGRAQDSQSRLVEFCQARNSIAEVRSVVAQALRRQLGCDAFPYSWVLGSSVPILWPLIDYLASYQAALLHCCVKILSLPSWMLPGLGKWATMWGLCGLVQGLNVDTKWTYKVD